MDEPPQHKPRADDPGDEAHRLLRDALGALGGASGASAQGFERRCVDLCPICRTADVLRATAPKEFQDHWYAWQREMLLALRALLDHYIDRVERERRRVVEVEDIPIE